MHTSWDFSGGFKAPGGAVYFLSSYELYRRPKGLARFPDGGRSKRLFSRTRLYRLQDKPPRLKPLWEGGNAAGKQPSLARFHLDGDVLRIAYPASNKLGDKIERYRLLEVETATGRVRELAGLEKRKAFNGLSPWKPLRESPHYLRITELNRRISGIPFDAWGLPSPLAYCKKKERGYIDDIVEMRGDLRYREAVIRRYSRGWTAKDIRKMLKRMDERGTRLEDGFAYKLYSADTRKELETLLPENGAEDPAPEPGRMEYLKEQHQGE